MTDPTRDALLARIDLAALADTLLGPARGTGAQRRWPCPAPSHGPQTGRTPPVTIFDGRDGIPRWHCHACRAGGTAIDLLMDARGLSVRDAFHELRTHTGTIHPDAPVLRARTPVRADATTRPRSARALAWARHALARYVANTERALWSPDGTPARQWLHERGFHPQVLKDHRVGFDPGPAQLPRAQGLPRRGPAIVWTVSDTHGPRYVQARYLDPDATGRKYDNPAAWLATNPRYAEHEPHHSPASRGVVVVCEGIPDALSVVQAGAPAVALLGAGLADRRAATWLHDHHPETPMVLAFDADTRGQAGSRELGAWLEDLEHPTLDLPLPPDIDDVNAWLRADAHGLSAAIAALEPPTSLPALTIDR